MSYLVISYLPSWDDYCRGCHMASYSSDHQIQEFDTIEEVESQIVSLECQEDLWEHTVYILGESREDEDYEVGVDREKIDGMVKFYKEKEQAREKERKTLLREKEKKDKENAERLEFARLQRKFGNKG